MAFLNNIERVFHNFVFVFQTEKEENQLPIEETESVRDNLQVLACTEVLDLSGEENLELSPKIATEVSATLVF